MSGMLRRLSVNAARASAVPTVSQVVKKLAAARVACAARIGQLIPLEDRRRIVDEWAKAGDEAIQAMKEAEVALAQLKDDMRALEDTHADTLAQKEDLKGWIQTHASTVKAEEAVHPVLGDLVRDLGYKKVYCASIRQLGNVPIWERQRILRKERAEAIATEKRKQGFPVKIPGIITMYQMPDGSYKLLDGQHRLAALKNLADGGIVNSDSNYILVEVFNLKKESEVKQLFTEINSAQPVKLIDMPDEARPNIKLVIDAATEKLRDKHPDMFKVSINCKLPHVNIDNLRNDLYQNHVVERYSFRTPDELLEWMEGKNQALAKRSTKDWARLLRGRNKDTVEKVVAKAQDKQFFLGLDRTWLGY